MCVNESTEHGKVVKAAWLVKITTPEELPEQVFLEWTEIWVKEDYVNYAVISCLSTALEVHPMAGGGWGVFRRRWMNNHHVCDSSDIHLYSLQTRKKHILVCLIPDKCQRIKVWKWIFIQFFLSWFLYVCNAYWKAAFKTKNFIYFNWQLAVEMGTAVQIQNVGDIRPDAHMGFQIQRGTGTSTINNGRRSNEPYTVDELIYFCFNIPLVIELIKWMQMIFMFGIICSLWASLCAGIHGYNWQP